MEQSWSEWATRWLARWASHRIAEDGPETQPVHNEEIISSEVDDLLTRYGVRAGHYSLRVVELPADAPADFDECIVYLQVPRWTPEIEAISLQAEKKLNARLRRFRLRARAVYWRMAAAEGPLNRAKRLRAPWRPGKSPAGAQT